MPSTFSVENKLQQKSVSLVWFRAQRQAVFIELVEHPIPGCKKQRLFMFSSPMPFSAGYFSLSHTIIIHPKVSLFSSNFPEHRVYSISRRTYKQSNSRNN